MDLLIATAALVQEATLATRNRRHFERIPALRLLTYRENRNAMSRGGGQTRADSCPVTVVATPSGQWIQ